MTGSINNTTDAQRHNGWPGDPGIPEEPGRHRHHWVYYTLATVPDPEMLFWDGEWFLGPDEDRGEGWRKPDELGLNWHYLGPVLSHEEIMCLQNRIVRLEEALGFYGGHDPENSDHERWVRRMNDDGGDVARTALSDG